ncbi:endonuclease [Deinococcus budaensis]|uniref:Serine protease n=1 Tax=Deinococcus budaensis TaxID=1665626 RepID=A0A7W8GD37_9DEIO|nr:endonuclease [Deinococcus budaensis]MBB5233352.1 endonuclease I/V8-like Glu-specific endopeptidase [Deinococcus budaensis]
MDIPPEVLEQTQARFIQRDPERGECRERLRSGGPLAADTEARVEARLARLGVPLPDARAVAGGHEDALAVAARLPEEARLGLERVIGANDLVGVAYLDLARAAARAVGRIVLRDARGRAAGYGTGWLCSPRALLTNHHVLEGAEAARSAVIEFDYELRPDGTLRDRVTLGLDPAALFVTSETLDYSLVAVQGDTSAFGWLPLFGSTGKALVGEALSIVQHPSGEPKQIALRENRLVDLLPDFLHYETDTAPGSSGSPVFNDAWEVVALHHSGVPRRDAQGRLLRRGGQPAQPGDPDTLLDWIANEGVRVSRIVEDLRRRPDAAGNALVAEVLAAHRPALAAPLTVAPAAQVSPAQGGPEAARVLDLGTVTVGEGGVATLPVTLRLRVGGGEAGRPAGPGPARPYLDPADAEQAAAYYAGRPEGGTPQARFLALSDLVTRTHTRPLGYDPADDLYPWVDLWPDGRLRSLYSAREHTPEELIQADRAVQERRLTLAAREGLNVDALEAALPYNCEHVVPQSWFGKREPMRGDLHHLFACEPDCNSFRGNTPYFDFPDYGEALRSDCGRRDPGEFEPAHGKGAAARATLYFLLRYPGVVRQYGERHLQTLLAWHAAEPPGDWERHRNAAIFEKQGNRNPLIDHPGWAGEVAFSEGLGR